MTTILPPPGNSKYMDALQRAMQLEPGEYIYIDLATQQEARSAKASLYQAIRRHGLQARALLRGTTVYVGRIACGN